jgi:gas vesicle protein
MRSLIFGAIVGGIAAWLYRSQQARDQVRERLANVPTPVREGAESLTAAAVSAAERAAGIIDSSALPRQVKDSALRVTSAIQSAAEETRPSEPEAAEGPAAVEAAVPDPVAHVAPDDVLAEEDAAQRAAAEARREQQSGV